MESQIRTTPVGFASHDGASTIRGLIWEPPTSTPRGLVQIVHGMAEYVGRYDDLARRLAAEGYLVFGADHIGHGHSAASPEDFGCLPPDGKEILIEDVHELRGIVCSRYARQTPYLIYGHSMGSFIVRAYLARHGQGVAGAVLSGTAQQPIAVSRLGRALALCLCKLRGPEHRSTFIDNLGVGAYSKQIEDARTPYDWICTDPAVVDAYAADEMCGFMFSVGGYAALLDLTGEIATKACAEKVPKDLPILFVAGDQDPVGSCGKGVAAAAEQLRAAGVQDVQVKLYPGMRHEVHNEPGRAQVYADVIEWMEAIA